MKLQEMLNRYIENTQVVLARIEIAKSVQIDDRKANSVIETARHYLEDAKYYRDRKRFETGLASIAYSEGLLEALRLLEVAEFSWSKKEL